MLHFRKVRVMLYGYESVFDIPPPSVFMKIVRVFASLVSVALLGALLFAASVAVSRQADGQVQYNIPQDFVVPQNGFRTIDAMVSDPTPGREVRCHNIGGTFLGPIERMIRRTGCTYTFTGRLVNGRNENTLNQQGSNTICFRSYTIVGNSLASQQCVTWRYRVGPASSVTFTAPTGLSVATNRMLVINALSYATETDSRYSITCGDATSIDTTELDTVERSGCMFTVTPKNVQGAASFAVPYTSYGGATTSHTIAVQVGPASDIVFTAPSPAPSVQSGSSIMLDASGYAADGSYTVSCGTATESSALISISAQTGCSLTVATGTGTGTAAITVPYRSSGGDTHDGIVNVQVMPASDIVFSAPASNPVVSIDQSRVFDMSSYAADGPYTITCGTATESSALISISAQTGCSVTVAAGSSTGTAVITVPYMSSGGDAHTAMLTVAVIDSNIVYTPPDITMQIGGILAINAASYATDGAYTITCGEVESKSPRIASISRNGCGYTITPASAGAAEFTITYTSSGGDTHQATIPITIEPSPTAPATPSTEPDYTPPADTTTTDTTPSGTTARADEAEGAALSWSTLTVQPGGTTARTIRQTLGLSSRRAIYAWNADTQTWTAITDPTRTIASGVVLSLRAPAEISREDLEIANIGQSTQRTALTQGWNIITPPETTTRTPDTTSSFLFDPSLTDCGNNPAVIAIASYNAQTRQWALWLPCHPQTQRTLTAGTDPPYRTLTRINPQDTTYIYTRTPQPINIAWNPNTQTYQPAT